MKPRGDLDLSPVILTRLDQLAEISKDHSTELKHMRKVLEGFYRIEERQSTHNEALKRFGSRMDSFESRLRVMELEASSRTPALKWAERAAMVITGAIVVKIVAMFSGSD